MNEFLAIFDSSPIGMFVLDEDALINLVNDSYLKLLDKKGNKYWEKLWK